MSQFNLEKLLAGRRYPPVERKPYLAPEELLERTLVTYPHKDVVSDVVADALVEMFRRVEAAKVWVVENHTYGRQYLSIRFTGHRHGHGYPEAYWAEDLSEAMRLGDETSANMLAWYLSGWRISEGAKIVVASYPGNAVPWKPFPSPKQFFPDLVP
jgi:hypothetical protein